MDDQKRSLSRAAKPEIGSIHFVGLKRDLAIVLLLVVALALLIVGLRLPDSMQVVALAAVGIAAAAWVIWRTKQAEARSRRFYADQRAPNSDTSGGGSRCGEK